MSARFFLVGWGVWLMCAAVNITTAIAYDHTAWTYTLNSALAVAQLTLSYFYFTRYRKEARKR